VLWHERRILVNNDDFKYVLQDFSKVYIGANYSYKEIQDVDDMPGKLKEISFRIFAAETNMDTTLGEHLSILKKSDHSYFAFRQMKVKLKVTFLIKKGNSFSSKYYNLDEFLEEAAQGVLNGECFVEELEIKKLHLAGLSV